jgi:pentatricopeptide repeat protein
MLDPSIYAKLIMELGKNPDRYRHVESLLDELGARDELNLSSQDCTAIMKVCAKMKKFDMVESLFSWFKQSGSQPSVVMYTSVIHSRYAEEKYREALDVVWEMEASNCLFDLPAYRMIIKLFVALNDLSRAKRYFSKLKEAGFSPTYGLYKDMLEIYMASGRIAKCKEICKEAEIAGFTLDKHLVSYGLINKAQ